MENDFWNKAWLSEKKTKNTEMLDLFISKKAVDFSYSLMGDVKGKKILEIGCGSGMQTVQLAKLGAKVTAIDVSAESVNAAKKTCRENDANAAILKMDAEKMDFKDGTFDFVYINFVLMHTDKDKVVNESLRVLKKGGKLVLKEVLKHWLFSFPYRTFSPYKGSKPEYVTLDYVKKIGARHKEFYLFSTAMLPLFFIFGNRKILYSLFNTIAAFDSIILKSLPFIRAVSWVTVGAITK